MAVQVQEGIEAEEDEGKEMRGGEAIEIFGTGSEEGLKTERG